MKSFISHIKYLLSIYFLGIILFSLIRGILLITQWEQVQFLPEPFILLAKAFLIGLWFDTVISCYILFFPLFILLLLSAIGIENRTLTKGIHIFICICYSLVLISCVGNIPYFNEFFKHINASILNWKDDKGFVFSMIKNDKTYILYFLLALVISIIFSAISSLIYKRIYKSYKSQIGFHSSYKVVGLRLFLFLILSGLCFLGVRGRISKKSPIRVGTAYFCNYAFPNQLGLNPIFYFGTTLIESQKQSHQQIHLMPDTDAINWARLYYQPTDTLLSPIARLITYQGEKKNYNVVVIIMEGMSAEYMKRHGNSHSQTTFLDSLSAQSTYFENYYTTGIHTMNGIFSTLFSYPALFMQHPMKSAEILHYGGLPYELKKNGYQTAYFTTHDDQFDNVGGFLAMNDVEFIMSQKNYPSDKVLSTLGVPDDYMFERSIQELNRMAANKKPFFAAMMTASNHGPITIPSYFKPKSGDLKDQILEYSDWALRKFFEMAKKEAWFDNTIFVFTADHGANVGEQLYEIPLSRLHSPLIIYKKDMPIQQKTSLASQVDIFPTIMGMLNISYVNNTFGQDLLAQGRKYVVINYDNTVACLSDSLMYLYSSQTGKEGLYPYKLKKADDLLQQQFSTAKDMKQYLFSTMQTAQYMINKRLVSSKRK